MLSRRAVLGLVGTVAALSAGCSAADPNASDDGTTDGGTAGDRTDASTRRPTDNGTPTGDRTGTDAEATDDGGTAPDADATFEMRLDGPETDRTLFTGADIAAVGEVRRRNDGSYGVPVTLTDETTAEVTATLNRVGATENPDEYEFVRRRDGEEVERFRLAPNLAQTIAEGEWDGRFVLMFANEETAAAFRQSLVEG